MSNAEVVWMQRRLALMDLRGWHREQELLVYLASRWEPGAWVKITSKDLERDLGRKPAQAHYDRRLLSTLADHGVLLRSRRSRREGDLFALNLALDDWRHVPSMAPKRRWAQPSPAQDQGFIRDRVTRITRNTRSEGHSYGESFAVLNDFSDKSPGQIFFPDDFSRNTGTSIANKQNSELALTSDFFDSLCKLFAINSTTVSRPSQLQERSKDLSSRDQAEEVSGGESEPSLTYSPAPNDAGTTTSAAGKRIADVLSEAVGCPIFEGSKLAQRLDDLAERLSDDQLFATLAKARAMKGYQMITKAVDDLIAWADRQPSKAQTGTFLPGTGFVKPAAVPDVDLSDDERAERQASNLHQLAQLKAKFHHDPEQIAL